MGGKPHQSKGCETCRKRKKGCDQQRPSCGQCLKAGIQCAGYNRQTKFINYGSSQNSGPVSPQSNISSRVNSPDTAYSGELSLMPTTCDKSIARIGWYGSFMDHWLPKNEASHRVDLLTRGTWMYDLPELAAKDALLACALDALSLIRLGITKHDNDMCASSEREYVRALGVLRKRIQKPERMQIATLLAVMLVLGHYEIYGLGTNKALGWSSHTEAALALVRQYDEAEVVENQDLYRKVRLGLRLDSIIRAIAQRDPIMLLSTPSLASDPDFIDNKTYRLYCILERMPAVFQLADAVRLEPPESMLAAVVSLANHHGRVAAQFRKWEEEQAPEETYSYTTQYSVFRDKDLPFEKQKFIWFPDLETAAAFLLLWTGYLQMYVSHCLTTGWLRNIMDEAIVDSIVCNEEVFTYKYKDVVPMAEVCVKNIEESLEYFLQPEVGSLAVRLIAFPMVSAMAWRSKRKQARSARCAAALKCLRQRDGVPLDTFVESMLASAATRNRA